MQTDLCRFLRSIEIDRLLFIISRMYLHKALFSTLAYPYDLLSSFQSFPFVMPLPKGGTQKCTIQVPNEVERTTAMQFVSFNHVLDALLLESCF